ncbi:cobalt ECF transporter T component CbiQ [Tissierella sp. Yu-01]|uniref:cobalt ECF transporter T component CbiQ n=1 Tax=Tissierella sp. Yu-01 TaxID=3035694 RepID=UPI00240E7161|nr:cobalt ECF transporter T component CbiQ [Tissierella sp. Yu-01]WFA10262.1 cobalt ECF transporter T component CbiQ [Tissierella sp. Yu-01]
MLLIDKYAYTNRLSNSNPFIKSVIVVIALAIATITKSIYVNLTILIIMGLLTTVFAGIPVRKYLKLLFVPTTFLVLSILTILISISKVNIYIWSIKLFNNYIGITQSSLDDSILLLTRVFASIASTFFLGLTTPLNSIIRVLKKVYIPNFLIELVVLIYRFIFIFLKEANEIYIGQELKFGYSNFKNSLRSTSLLIRSLFTRVMISYMDMVVVLECKLYEGEFKTGD